MKREDTPGGTSLCTLLTVMLVTLKLCKVIAWSWWWVLAPLWAPWATVAAVGAVIMVAAVGYKVATKALGRGAAK